MEIKEFFSRMTTIPEIGEGGLERLRSSRVTLVGAGGVGSAIASYLGQMGVGYLRIVDQDIVQPSNIHRLHVATPARLYHPKAEVAAETVASSNPSILVEPIVDTLRSSNADELLSCSDLVVDGLDNFRSRYIVNRYTHQTNVPYLFTSAVAQQGHLALFSSAETGCLECMAPGVIDRPEESCENLGVTPTIVGLVGAIAANEASKVILGLHTKLKGKLLTIDFMTLQFVLSRVSKLPTCNVCSGLETEAFQSSEPVVELCNRSSFRVLPEVPMKVDLQSTSDSIPRDSILAATDTALVYRMDGTMISLFRTGIILIEGIASKEHAFQLAKRIWQQARKSDDLRPS